MAHLSRVVRSFNPSYKRNGPKSYVYLLNKYGFQPTLEGPYFYEKHDHHHGSHGRHKVLRKKNHHPGNVDGTGPAQPPASGTPAGEPAQSSKASGAGEVTAEDQQNDSEYLCPVTIGTPGQTFNLDFDTGSADLWIFSTELPQSTISSAGSNHTTYDPTKSSTYKATGGASWKIGYGDGSSASGTVGTDNITVGGLTVRDQTIELAKTLSAQFASGVGDGLLGLAFDTINTVSPGPAKTPVDNMIAQSDIANGVFTAHLASWRDPSADKEPVSFYTFGYVDEKVLHDSNVTEPHYVPVDSSQGFWAFDSASATVGGKTIARSGNTAIADTGTTLALVDDAICKAIYAAIPGSSYDSSQQGWVFPSTVTPAQLPVVTFAVGDRQFAVPKGSLAFANAGNGTVYGGIQSRGSMTFDILGDTFLKGIYAIFDQANKRFGAVQRPDPTGDTLAPSQS